MSSGLLRGFGAGLSQSGDLLFRAAMQEQRQRWQEEYQNRVTADERAYQTDRDALKRQQQLDDAKTAREWELEDRAAAAASEEAKRVAKVEYEGFEKVEYNSEGQELKRETWLKPGDLTEAQSIQAKGLQEQAREIRDRINDLRVDSMMDPEEAATRIQQAESELDEVYRQQAEVLRNAGVQPREEEPAADANPTLDRADVLADAKRQYPNMGDAELNRMVDAFMRDNGAPAANVDSKASPPPSQAPVSSGPPEWLTRAREGVASDPAVEPAAPTAEAASSEPRYGAGLDTIFGTPARAVGGLLRNVHSKAASDSGQRAALETVRSAMRMNRPVSKEVLEKALLVATGEERKQIMAMLAE